MSGRSNLFEEFFALIFLSDLNELMLDAFEDDAEPFLSS